MNKRLCRSKCRRAQRSFPKGGDHAQTIAADRDGVVIERACCLGSEEAGERLPIHLRDQAVWQRSRVDEGRPEQVHNDPVSLHDLDAGLTR